MHHTRCTAKVTGISLLSWANTGIERDHSRDPKRRGANPGHVVMYLGRGQVIQAPQTGEDVQIDPIDLPTIVAATRPSGLVTSP